MGSAELRISVPPSILAPAFADCILVNVFWVLKHQLFFSLVSGEIGFWGMGTGRELSFRYPVFGLVDSLLGSIKVPPTVFS